MDYENDMNQRHPMRGRFRGNGRSAGQSRTQFHGNNQGRPQGPSQNFPKVTLEQRNKPQSSGMGRGCTIENPSKYVSVSDKPLFLIVCVNY